MALLKLILEKQFTVSPSVEQYSRMFERFVHDCAIRAQKRSTPATYQELCVIWNTFIAPNAMTPMSLAMVDSRINKRFS